VIVVLRIIGLAVVIALGFVALAWMLTGDRKWLLLGWRIFRYAVFAVTFVLILFAGEALFRVL
jgi:hypothetical protein